MTSNQLPLYFYKANDVQGQVHFFGEQRERYCFQRSDAHGFDLLRLDDDFTPVCAVDMEGLAIEVQFPLRGETAIKNEFMEWFDSKFGADAALRPYAGV